MNTGLIQSGNSTKPFKRSTRAFCEHKAIFGKLFAKIVIGSRQLFSALSAPRHWS